MYLKFNEIKIVVQKSALKMERLVVLLALLTVVAGCRKSLPKDFVFGCPAPNNKGLQAVFKEFSKLPKINLSASSISRIGRLLHMNSYLITPTPEYEKLQQFLCDKAFVDSTTYQDYFWSFAWAYSNSDTPVIPDSELREDFLNFTSNLYQSEMYRKSQEILYKHIRSDPYAQLGMEYLDSAERRQLMREVLSIPELKPEVDQLRSVGLPVDEGIELFAFAAVSMWARE